MHSVKTHNLQVYRPSLSTKRASNQRHQFHNKQVGLHLLRTWRAIRLTLGQEMVLCNRCDDTGTYRDRCSLCSGLPGGRRIELPCGDCRGSGRVSANGDIRACGTCDGKATVPVWDECGRCSGTGRTPMTPCPFCRRHPASWFEPSSSLKDAVRKLNVG